MANYTFYEDVLLKLFSTLDGSVHISVEVLADLSHYNERPIDIQSIAKAAGCRVLTINTVGEPGSAEAIRIIRETE